MVDNEINPPNVPAMTTGMMDFIIASGLITAIAAIPVPDFAVPYAAPIA